ncbi:hypothetical protein VTJ83DRAFT_3118 [Remersonia thermophila]|uniref:Extracellular membrane protein CFEM domain-containing protein n=1 Tax=Remersonia thermophila TaxID=72144 RepID=A0ABR4DD97_9PEZI
MASASSMWTGVWTSALVLFCFTTGVFGGNMMCETLWNTQGFSRLSMYERFCAGSVDPTWGVCARSPCDDMSCFCADPQWLSDETDRCIRGVSGHDQFERMNSIDTYNAIMAFFANECGTFQPQFKQATSQSTVNPSQTSTGSNQTSVLTTTQAAESSSASSPPQEGNKDDEGSKSDGLNVGEIIAIVSGVATIITVPITIFMCLPSWRQRVHASAQKLLGGNAEMKN